MTNTADAPCPVCGEQLVHCYGFAGGGLGPYSICTGCDRIISKHRTDPGDCFENVRVDTPPSSEPL